MAGRLDSEEAVGAAFQGAELGGVDVEFGDLVHLEVDAADLEQGSAHEVGVFAEGAVQGFVRCIGHGWVFTRSRVTVQLL